MEYTIKKLGEMAGISSRTLRYYDEIDLLKPTRINSSGYRIYGQKEVDTLQQILFYRELGLELQQIGEIIYQKDFKALDALESHLSHLMERKQRIDQLIETVSKTIAKEKGEIQMADKEKFAGFKENLIKVNEEKYGQEIRAKYGNEKIDESNRKMMNLSEADYQKMQQLSTQIQDRLEVAVETGERPDSEVGKAIAALHKEWLSYTWPSYSAEAHLGLGEMYVADERFTAYYDSKVSGCALFLRDAIKSFTSN